MLPPPVRIEAAQARYRADVTGWEGARVVQD